MDKKKILVVEDEKAISDILVFNLQREGYDTLAAYDGAEGLRCALEEAPDLILLDVMLPEMDGFEVCRRVRAEKDTPIIMLTARVCVYPRTTAWSTKTVIRSSFPRGNLIFCASCPLLRDGFSPVRS